VKEWSEEAKISSILQQGEFHLHTTKVSGNAGGGRRQFPNSIVNRYARKSDTIEFLSV
jgi:hypothetical protein